MAKAKITILINRHPYQFDTETLGPGQIRGAVDAPPNYEVWQIIRDPDPEGQLPTDDEQIIDSIKVKNGDRFRVVPPGTFG